MEQNIDGIKDITEQQTRELFGVEPIERLHQADATMVTFYVSVAPGEKDILCCDAFVDGEMSPGVWNGPEVGWDWL